MPETWFSRRRYLHFDAPLTEAVAAAYVKNSANVIHHSFLPFLRYTLTTPRVRESASGKLEANPKDRPISYPAHRDGHIFSYYKQLLEPPYEQWLRDQGLSDCVTAFRGGLGRNNISLSRAAFDFIRGRDWDIVATDIKKFFDNLDHVLLKQAWATLLSKNRLPDDHYAVFKAITHYSIVERDAVYGMFDIPLPPARSGKLRICSAQEFRQTVTPKIVGNTPNKGIPQGSSLSPTLSNIYMGGLDLAVHKEVARCGGRYWRYCDDVLVVVPHGLSARIQNLLESELQRVKLELNPDKTQCLSTVDLATTPVQYLGFIFDGTNTALRPQSIHKYRRKVKAGIKAAQVRRRNEDAARVQNGKPPGAPLRRQALYNMYADVDGSRWALRGRKIVESEGKRKHGGNYMSYVNRSIAGMQSKTVEQQRNRLLRKLLKDLREASA